MSDARFSQPRADRMFFEGFFLFFGQFLAQATFFKEDRIYEIKTQAHS